MNESYKITIIIPCLNEEHLISECLEWLTQLIDSYKLPAEILVIDDNSDDLTHQKCMDWIASKKCLNVQIIRRTLERRGYGAVVRRGVAASKLKYCIFVSADMVDPIHLIPQMYEKASNGADVVQCSRYANPTDAETIPFIYKFYQFFYRISVRFCLGETIADSTYAFKIFDREKILELGMTQNRFSISPEIFFKAYLSGLNIDYVLGGQGVRKVGVSKFKFTKEGFGFLYCLARAWLHRHKIIYWF